MPTGAHLLAYARCICGGRISEEEIELRAMDFERIHLTVGESLGDDEGTGRIAGKRRSLRRW